jgi:hypothetical protein
VSKRLGSPYRSGRSPHWVKVKNPKAPAVKREAEEDWGRNRRLCAPGDEKAASTVAGVCLPKAPIVLRNPAPLRNQRASRFVAELASHTLATPVAPASRQNCFLPPAPRLFTQEGHDGNGN